MNKISNKVHVQLWYSRTSRQIQAHCSNRQLSGKFKFGKLVSGFFSLGRFICLQIMEAFCMFGFMFGFGYSPFCLNFWILPYSVRQYIALLEFVWIFLRWQTWALLVKMMQSQRQRKYLHYTISDPGDIQNFQVWKFLDYFRICNMQYKCVFCSVQCSMCSMKCTAEMQKEQIPFRSMFGGGGRGGVQICI